MNANKTYVDNIANDRDNVFGLENLLSAGFVIKQNQRVNFALVNLFYSGLNRYSSSTT